MRTTETRKWKTPGLLGLVLLIGSSVLVGCPRSERAESAHVGDFTVSVRISPDPPSIGENRLFVGVRGAHGGPVEGASLEVGVSMPAMGAMAAMRSAGQVRAVGGGEFEVTYALAAQGDWTLVLRISAVGQRTSELRLSISPPRKGVVLHPPSAESSPPDAAAESAAEGGGGRVMDVSPSRQQLIGVTWGEAEVRPLALSLRVPARVEVDEAQVADVTLRYPAFVEKVYVARTGQSVRQGEALLTLYSPELLGAEQDLLVARRGGETTLVAAAEERLRLWGVDGEQLRALVARGTAEPRLTVHSPLAGVVLLKNVVEGSRAETGAPLYRIGNLGRVWVVADAFQGDASVLAVGQQARMSVPGLPAASWSGRVSFIYPTVDERTRSLRLRLEFANAEATLRPGMYADVVVLVPLGERLTVPDSALLHSGEHSYVFVRRGAGRLQPVEVTVGVSNGEWTEVLSGLKVRDEVAQSAAFLLSSEAQLRDALPRWRTP